MSTLNKKLIVLCSIIILFLIGRIIIFKGALVVNYTNLINPLFWLFMVILSFLMMRTEGVARQRSKYDIIQTVIIIVIIYSMIYFSLGLFFGYERSPYSREIGAIIKNLWAFGIIVVFQEYVRNQLVRLCPKKVRYYILITLLFIIADITFWNISSNFRSNVDFFKYVSETIIPLIVTNALFTYLSITSGFVSSSIYRSVMVLLTLLLPIYPSINWLIKSMLEIILVIITALYVNYVELRSGRVLNKKQIKKEKVTAYIPFVIVLILIVCFISGTFKIQPIAVLSNSMVPEFSRGDAVIVEKISKKDLKKLKKGTIIYYSKESKLIIHRITSIEITTSGSLKIVTKGDNNSNEDPWTVDGSDVIGIVKFMIPYIGYPSVLANELLK